ncbi:MAG: exodeoxyribonuclease III [Methanomassiliicoccales archaeon]
MRDLRILSWNVNGLRAVLQKGFIEWLRSDNPDIICIQETKISDRQMPRALSRVRGYHIYLSSSQEKKGYSGVGLFSKREPISIENGIGIEKFDKEGRIQIARYEDFLLFNVYFPNGKASMERLRYKLEFYDHFLHYVKKFLEKDEKIIICGDVNTAHKEIDLARPKENEKVSGFLPEERAWIDRLIESGFLDTFRVFNQSPGQYSWWDMKTKARERNVGWRIDYFFISRNMLDRLKTAFILKEVQGSDHCPVGIELI